MATETRTRAALERPLVKITEMDHIVLRTRDVEESLRFYTEVWGCSRSGWSSGGPARCASPRPASPGHHHRLPSARS